MKLGNFRSDRERHNMHASPNRCRFLAGVWAGETSSTLKSVVSLLLLVPLSLVGGCKTVSRSHAEVGEPTPIIFTVLEEEQKTELRRTWRSDSDVIQTSWSDHPKSKEPKSEDSSPAPAPPSVLVELLDASPKRLRPRPQIVPVTPRATPLAASEGETMAAVATAEECGEETTIDFPQASPFVSRVDWQSNSSRRTKSAEDESSSRLADRSAQPPRLPSHPPPRELNEQSTVHLRQSVPGDGDDASDELVFRPITEISTDIARPTLDGQSAADEEMRLDMAARFFGRYEEYTYRSEVPRPWGAYGAQQITQAFCHRPLYFEEINVERFGYSAGILQPAVSAVRFFATVPTLPYRMAIDGPGICQIDPSPYPPGNPAPRHRQRPPLHVRAAIIQAVAVVGMVALLP